MLGFCELEEFGVPPVKVHAHEVGVFVLKSVKATDTFVQTVVGVAEKFATGTTAQE